MNTRIKLLALSLLLFLAFCGTSCTESQASSKEHLHENMPENGAQFKEGKGVALTEVMAQSIDIKTGEVTEENMTPALFLQLQTVQRGNEATGWLTEAQAAGVRPGMEAQLRVGKTNGAQMSGKVTRVEKSSLLTSGDYEITVETDKPLDAGTPISATVRLDPSEGRTAIPKSALLSTAEGHFAYAKNGDFFLRTPIKIGAVSDGHVEVTDGLYAGDEVATSAVMSLWLAELQVLRGGKACTCGH